MSVLVGMQPQLETGAAEGFLFNDGGFSNELRGADGGG